jgi:hypothetical protein
MASPLFQKESISVNPFVSIRDWTMFFGVLAIFGGAFLGFQIWTSTPSGLIQSMTLGAFVGMIPSLVLVLPVRGVVPGREKGRFLAEITKRRFIPAHEEAALTIYTFCAPWWAKWESNRVVLQDLEDGDIQTTIPLYLFRRLAAASK